LLSLTDELDNLTAAPRCATCEWCATRSPAEQERINEQMRLVNDSAKRYGLYSDLYAVLRRHGLPADKNNFMHHCRTHVDAD
jgi:hypothetical protein